MYICISISNPMPLIGWSGLCIAGHVNTTAVHICRLSMFAPIILSQYIVTGSQ